MFPINFPLSCYWLENWYQCTRCRSAELERSGYGSIFHSQLDHQKRLFHYNGVIMSAIVSLITGVLIVCPTVCPGADQRKHQGSTLLAFVRGIHRRPVNSPHKGPVTRNVFPFDDVIMRIFMTKSWYGSVFRITGAVWVGSAGHPWFSLTKDL